MGRTTIQISRFDLPHDQIDYPLVDVRTTKKSSTSQLRRWKPQSNPTVLFCISHAFPADVPQQFNNSSKQQLIDRQPNQFNSVCPSSPPSIACIQCVQSLSFPHRPFQTNTNPCESWHLSLPLQYSA